MDTRLAFLMVTLITVPGLAGCGSRDLKIDIAPTYSEINRIVIQPKCVQCHASLATYTGVQEIIHPFDASASHFYRVVSQGEMPMQSPPLSDKEVTAIKDWINAGAGQ